MDDGNVTLEIVKEFNRECLNNKKSWKHWQDMKSRKQSDLRISQKEIYEKLKGLLVRIVN